MCFDADSHPPIEPVAGAATDHHRTTLTASDGNEFAIYEAFAGDGGATGVVILPDVRGLHAFYRELALRFAENGIDAVAIDWFGRTAGLGLRREGFDHASHIAEVQWPGVSADIAAGVAHAKTLAGSVFTIGFCFGGRSAFLSSTLGLGLAGAIGMYGPPVGVGRGGSPAPVDVAGEIASPILGLFGSADDSIPATAIAAFDAALTEAGVEHRLKAYPGAPHSFFDRKADQFAEAAADAWQEIRGFIRSHAG